MTGVEAIAMVVLLALNGTFVAAEFALLAVRRARVAQLAAGGDRRARIAETSLNQLSRMMAGAQLGITMCSLGLGIVAEPALARTIEPLLETAGIPLALTHPIAFGIALSIVVFFHLVVGEMAPKSWAIASPERAALTLAVPFRAFVVVFSPVIRLLNGAANLAVRAVGVQPADELAMTLSARDLRLLVDESGAHGTIATEQQAMLGRALEVAGLDAAAAMIPRHRIVWVDAATGIEQMEAVAAETGRSRLVTCDGELDAVRGIVHVKDLLGLNQGERAATTAAELARPAVLTPESRALSDLLIDMRAARQHVAVVVDEHGVVTGLVTLEDVLEELIGEFEDETDRTRRRRRRRSDGAVTVPADLRPDELMDRAGVEIPEGPWETVAGYLTVALDRLPQVGDVVREGDAQLTVTRMEGHRVAEVRIAITPGTGGAEPDVPSGQ